MHVHASRDTCHCLPYSTLACLLRAACLSPTNPQCSHCGCGVQAARWAAEQLTGLDPSLLQQANAAVAAGTAGSLQLDPQDRHPQYMLARQQFEFKVCAPESKMLPLATA